MVHHHPRWKKRQTAIGGGRPHVAPAPAPYVLHAWCQPKISAIFPIEFGRMNEVTEARRILNGRYALLPNPKAGGMADVYCATDLDNGGQKVAVKMLRYLSEQDAIIAESFVGKRTPCSDSTIRTSSSLSKHVRILSLADTSWSWSGWILIWANTSRRTRMRAGTTTLSMWACQFLVLSTTPIRNV